MIVGLLLTCGLVLAAFGTWYGYLNARSALVPLVREGDPTRARIDARRPVLARTRVRRFARSAVLSICWLAIALYGLYMASMSLAALR
jgi:hypothetical protein